VTPTREQVRQTIEDARLWCDRHPERQGYQLEPHLRDVAMANAVMDLLADAELDAEGELREQLTARYEQRLAKPLAEAPQPKVLWEGETLPTYRESHTMTGPSLLHGSVLPRVDVPPGTRVVVVEDTAPPATEDPGECPVCVAWAGSPPPDHTHDADPARGEAETDG
jgi:hypothetical protein